MFEGWSKIEKKTKIKVVGCRRAVSAAGRPSGAAPGGNVAGARPGEDNVREVGAVPYAAVGTAASVEAAVNAQEVEIEVDEVKMEAEDHLAREYVQEFVLDHLETADVKREVSLIFHAPPTIVFGTRGENCFFQLKNYIFI